MDGSRKTKSQVVAKGLTKVIAHKEVIHAKEVGPLQVIIGFELVETETGVEVIGGDVVDESKATSGTGQGPVVGIHVVVHVSTQFSPHAEAGVPLLVAKVREESEINGRNRVLVFLEILGRGAADGVFAVGGPVFALDGTTIGAVNLVVHVERVRGIAHAMDLNGVTKRE